jgi:hypothetical protein
MQNELQNKTSFVISKCFHSRHWEDESFFRKHSEFHSSFIEVLNPPVSQTDSVSSTLPVFYSNSCSRLVVIGDALLNVFACNSDPSLFFRVISVLSPLYRAFHQFPISFVKELLNNALDIHSFDVKQRRQISKLFCMISGIHLDLMLTVSNTLEDSRLFSPTFIKMMNDDSSTPSIFASKKDRNAYFHDVIGGIARCKIS